MIMVVVTDTPGVSVVFAMIITAGCVHVRHVGRSDHSPPTKINNDQNNERMPGIPVTVWRGRRAESEGRPKALP